MKLWRFETDIAAAAANEQRDLSSSAEQWRASPKEGMAHNGTFHLPAADAHQMFNGFKRSMDSLVKALLSAPNLRLDNASWHVQALLSAIEERVRANSAASEENVFDVLELAEGHLMSRLHPRVFGTSTADKELDSALDSRLRQLSFLQAENLEIPAEIQLDCEAFKEASNALKEMNKANIPSKMIGSVVHCCRCIHNLIHQAKEQLSLRKHQARADSENSLVNQEEVMLEAKKRR